MRTVTRMALTAPVSLLGGLAAGTAVFLVNPGGMLLAESGSPACRLLSTLGAITAGFAAFAGASWLMGWFGPVRRGQAVVVAAVVIVAVGMAAGYVWLWGWPVWGHFPPG